MSHASINGHTCHYRIEGPENAPAIVFVHGTFLNSGMWEAQVNYLRDEYRTVTYDLRGYGESTSPERFSRYEWIEDLGGLLDHIEIGRAVICGTTMGGPIALQFTLDYPERVRGLVLAACGPGPRDATPPLPDAFYEMREKQIEILNKNGIIVALENQGYLQTLSHPAMRGNDPTIPERIRKIVSGNDPAEYANMLRAGMHFKLNDSRMSTRGRIDRLFEIKCPVVIVTGELDRQFNEQSRFMAEAIPNATFHEVPQQGALLTLSAPDAFNRLIKTFCRSVLEDERNAEPDGPKGEARLELEGE
ncbi:MAG: alpha/beta fold hydrolase [Planctomycetota bacterium]|jgi:pimeloyl-ACP methyl ester carboxylesterase